MSWRSVTQSVAGRDPAVTNRAGRIGFLDRLVRNRA